MKLNKKMYKQKKGITLVALVITIIILLILAGVAIAQLTGNGLFENAKLAKEKSENAQRLENSTMQDYGDAINEVLSGSHRENDKKVIDENERIIGTFYGKTLYQKSFTGTTPNSSTSLLDVSDLNIDTCTKIEGIVNNGISWVPLGWSNSSIGQYLGVFYCKSNNTLEFRSHSTYFKQEYYITIEYTKNAESAE